MNETTALVDDYRARLRAASAGLPVDVRDELLDDVEAHLAELRATSPSPAATRDALGRLGEPEAIAAAAHRELGDRADPPNLDDDRAPAWRPPPAPTSRRGRVRALDVIAVVLLLIGGFFPPVLGWVVGVVLLWASATWTWREKLLGTLVVPGGLTAVFGYTFFATQTCLESVSSDAAGTITRTQECSGFALPPWLGIPLLVVLLVAPIVVATVLLRRAAARAA